MHKKCGNKGKKIWTKRNILSHRYDDRGKYSTFAQLSDPLLHWKSWNLDAVNASKVFIVQEKIYRVKGWICKCVLSKSQTPFRISCSESCAKSAWLCEYRLSPCQQIQFCKINLILWALATTRFVNNHICALALTHHLLNKSGQRRKESLPAQEIGFKECGNCVLAEPRGVLRAVSKSPPHSYERGRCNWILARSLNLFILLLVFIAARGGVGIDALTPCGLRQLQ